MPVISHHVPDALIAAYAAGSLEQPYALVLASHISMCVECRAAFEAHQAVGGAVLENTHKKALSDGLKSSVMAQLDTPFHEAPSHKSSGIYPGPIMEALKGKPPHWRSLGMGIRQCVLSSGQAGAARLLFIPGGKALPDHSHGGLELTLVLQGSFSDETGCFGVGDIEVADESLEHTPIANEGAPCICLAATNAPLRFSSFLPKLVQSITRI